VVVWQSQSTVSWARGLLRWDRDAAMCAQHARTDIRSVDCQLLRWGQPRPQFTMVISKFTHYCIAATHHADCTSCATNINDQRDIASRACDRTAPCITLGDAFTDEAEVPPHGASTVHFTAVMLRVNASATFAACT
jgi:hypothetical protein